MPEEKKSKTIAEEAGLDPNHWTEVDSEPLVPGQQPGRGGAPVQGPQGFKSTSDMPPYFSGSISPDLAHDADYVRSQIASPSVPTVPLMPVAQSGKPSHNAAIQSIVKSTVTAVPDVDPFLHFVGVWNSAQTYAINDVVTWNGSTYVAITTSTGLRPDQNPSAWTLLSENFNFLWKPIVLQTNLGQGGSSYGTSFNQNVQAGSSIIVGVVSNGNLFTSASITDSQGNTYALIKMSARLFDGGFYWTALFAANNAVGGPDTITTTFSGSGLGATDFTLIAEVNGPLIGNVDGTATASVLGNSGDSFPSMSLPVTNAGELIFTLATALACNNGAAPSGYSSFFAPSPTSVDAFAWTQNSTPGMDTIQWGGTVTSGSSSPISMVAASFFLPSDTFKPYDVVEFRGSMFVCLQETSLDAFTAPSSWALLGPGTGYVSSLSANYTAVSTDAGHLLSFNSSSARTLTLPNPVPAPFAGTSETGWFILVENLGTGTLTINPNGLQIDGSAANLTLGQNQGIGIFADATGNYETWHGVNSIVAPSILTVSGPDGSGQVTIGLATESANLFFMGPTSGRAAIPAFRVGTNRRIQ